MYTLQVQKKRNLNWHVEKPFKNSALNFASSSIFERKINSELIGKKDSEILLVAQNVLSNNYQIRL